MTNDSKEIAYLRADGNPQIGLGHIYRLIALAEILKEKFDCHFIIQSPTSEIESVILQTCSKVISIPSSLDFEKEAEYLTDQVLSPKSIVVLDGYNFDKNYQSRIKQKDCFLAYIDDLVIGDHVADVIINHAGGVSAQDYSTKTNTQF